VQKKNSFRNFFLKIENGQKFQYGRFFAQKFLIFFGIGMKCFNFWLYYISFTVHCKKMISSRENSKYRLYSRWRRN
jgi:hypothetical protein